MTPIGTLTKKIHSQPKCWTRTPPSRGPVIVASPATPAPHPHRGTAFGRREEVRDERERLRRHQRSAEALHGTRGDQQLDRAGQPAPQ
jgi:hypothetical protein